MLIYIAKMLVFYAVGGVLAATLTSGLDPLDPAAWWDEPIVYQKLVVWIVLVEVLGIGGAWGPLAGHFKPMTGGVRYWPRPGRSGSRRGRARSRSPRRHPHDLRRGALPRSCSACGGDRAAGHG